MLPVAGGLVPVLTQALKALPKATRGSGPLGQPVEAVWLYGDAECTNPLKMPQLPVLVFTDLDATLLDHNDYSFEAARPALSRLRELDIPVIPNTSKTLAELETLTEALGNPHPCGWNPDDNEEDRELSAPGVTARILQPADLAGYRNDQVYIRHSLHTPPGREAVRDLMPALFDLIKDENNLAVRVVLGHLIFVYIHP